MAPGGGGNQAITGRQSPAHFLRGRREFSPDAAGLKINGEKLVGIMAFQGLQPNLKRALLPAVPEKSDPFGDFADRENANEQVLAVQSLDGTPHAGMRPGAAQLGQDARIQQDSHSFTSLMGERSRVRLSR